MRNNADVWLRVVMRCLACLTVLAFPFVVVPFEWMAAIHDWLGLGDLPQIPIVGYLARSLSWFYGLFGVLTFVLASDLKRNWPLITLWAYSSVVFGLAILAIDVNEGMPMHWTLGEGPFIILFGLLVISLQRLARPKIELGGEQSRAS